MRFPFWRPRRSSSPPEPSPEPALPASPGADAPADADPLRWAATQAVTDLMSPLSPLESWKQMGLSVVSDGFSPWGPFSSLEEQDAFVRNWVAEAEPRMLDVLVGLALDPPQPRLRDDDDWRYNLSKLIEEWARQKPEGWLEAVAPLLTHEHTRLIALMALAGVEHEAALPYLEPLARNAGQLSSEEREFLRDVLGDMHHPTIPALLDEMP